MRIQIDGTNTQNKGAELMLYAILEQIQKKDPNAEIVINSINADCKRIKTNLNINKPLRLEYAKYIWSLLLHMHLPYTYFSGFYPDKGIDILLDGSGFKLGDQWERKSDYLNMLENYYKKLKRCGTKIVLLPQALGPFNSDSGKKSAEILNKYADIIIAREEFSRKNLIDANISAEKILQYPDFTNTVKGIFPDNYSTAGKVCIIPNKKMITHSTLKAGDYLKSLCEMIEEMQKMGKEVFLLNHEGDEDLKICHLINKQFNNQLFIANNLDAKQIKAVIGRSFMVFSSRYHGVASALNQSVPCLASSWSFKYQLLFNDFGLTDQIIDLNGNKSDWINKIHSYLDSSYNKQMRLFLESKNTSISKTTVDMWNEIWDRLDVL